jgi:cell division inhibitor SepF
MGGALRKTMVYLGLAEEDERYDAYDSDADLGDAEADEAPGRRPSTALDYLDRHEERVEPRADERRAAVTPIGRGHVSRVVPAHQVAAELHRICTIHPRTYNEAKTIGEAFRNGTPVIMNLTDLSDSDAKRLVDFAAGLVFGLHGAIEKVTAKVFLLSPANVEVSPAEKARVPERGFFNQS